MHLQLFALPRVRGVGRLCPWCDPHVPVLLFLDKYAVRFIPHENGIHTIDVKFNGSHVVGSPFKVRVGEPGQAGNPALVSAYGAGLEGGTTGNTIPHVLSLLQI